MSRTREQTQISREHYAARVKKFGLENPPVLHDHREQIYKIQPLEVTLVSDERVRWTIEAAAEYLAYPAFKGERKVIDTHVRLLREQMLAGRFNWNNITIACCILDGLTYKVNGQHTSWARLHISEKIAPEIRLLTYKASNIEQLKALYSTFDRDKPRTGVHLTRVELVNTAPAHQLWTTTLNIISRGVKLWLYEKQDDQNRCSPAQLAALITSSYAVPFNTIGLFMQSLSKEGYSQAKRSAVIAAMFATYSVAPDAALLFWRDTLEGTNLDKNCARWHLRRYLQSTVIRNYSASKRVVNAEEMYRISIVAWNRWRKGEKVSHLRATDERIEAI